MTAAIHRLHRNLDPSALAMSRNFPIQLLLKPFWHESGFCSLAVRTHRAEGGALPGMMQAVEWAESTEDLYARYRSERDVEQRRRFQALWRLWQGETEVARQAGIGRRSRAHPGSPYLARSWRRHSTPAQ